MRSVVLRLALSASAVFGSAAYAADYGEPVLRGSQTYEVGQPAYRDWNGFYVGGQVGSASSTARFSDGVSELVANILRFTTVEDEFHPSEWANLPKRSTTRPSYGVFVGYNVQFEDTILGIEASYNRTDARVSSGDSIARQVQTSDGYLNDVAVSGTASAHLTDYGTLRARVGWVYNNFIPYGFFGAAFGRASLARTAAVTVDGTDADPIAPPVLPPFSFSAAVSEAKSGAVLYGWTLGGGVDWAVLPNVFLRGEYEYVYFSKVLGINLSVATARIGAGIRF